MEIVAFNEEHYEECWLMGLDFFDTTRYRNELPDKDDVISMFEVCRDMGISFVALDEYGNPIGMLLAVKEGLWINKDIIASQEIMWWVDEDYRATTAGVRLIKAHEQACITAGVQYIGMSLLSTSPIKLKNWLERKGYEQMEVSFVKENI